MINNPKLTMNKQKKSEIQGQKNPQTKNKPTPEGTGTKAAFSPG